MSSKYSSDIIIKCDVCGKELEMATWDAGLWRHEKEEPTKGGILYITVTPCPNGCKSTDEPKDL
jgi:deoxycytidylate deaminase